MKTLGRCCVVVVTCVVGACAAPAPAPAPAPAAGGGAAPADLVLELSITRATPKPIPTGLPDRAGRWVIFPDGALHYGDRTDLGADWLPGKTRTLTRPQLARLWRMLNTSGFADPAAGAPPGSFELLPAPARGVQYALALSAGNDRWSFVRDFELDAIPVEYSELARTLGALAWIPDAPPRTTRIIPRRYDFGPDPYARFRQP